MREACVGFLLTWGLQAHGVVDLEGGVSDADD